MTLSSRFRSWLRTTVRRSRMESDMDAELRFHIETFAEDLVRGGLPRADGVRRNRASERRMPRSARCDFPSISHPGYTLRPPHAAEIPRLHRRRGAHPRLGHR